MKVFPKGVFNTRVMPIDGLDLNVIDSTAGKIVTRSEYGHGYISSEKILPRSRSTQTSDKISGAKYTYLPSFSKGSGSARCALGKYWATICAVSLERVKSDVQTVIAA